MKPIFRILLLMTIFSIAMAFLETAVVVYLRELYFPTGFALPMVSIPNHIIVTELGRELATLIMLLTAGMIAGKNFAQRFGYFIFSFAIWDIFYYVFLKLILDWPATILDWDVLFLLPVPWVGPVLAPCIISLTMIALNLMIVYLSSKDIKICFRWYDWALMIAGSLILILSFTEHYFYLVINSGKMRDSVQMLENIRGYIPKSYNWWIFSMGILILVADMAILYRRSVRRR